MPKPSRRPNILVIMVDQLAPQFLAAYGHKVVKTPHIDRLAEYGMVFEAAYCNAPLCAPARYVMMTGRLPSKIGAWDNASELPAEVPTFAHYLAVLGYRTCLSGKMHFCGPDQLHGFEERLTTDVYPADFTWSPNWDEPERRLDWFHSMEVVRDAGVCTRSTNLDYDDEVAFAARRHLFDIARGGDDRPFCLVASFIHPHDPYITRPQYWDLYTDDGIDMPSVTLDQVDDDPHSRRLRRLVRMDDPAPTEAEVRRARRAYYGSISYVDEKIGELLATLDEAGFGDNTMVVLTADHGDMLGERGQWFKMSWFEHSARVPLIAHWPSAFGSGRHGGAVSLVDVLPTLVDAAGDGAEIENPTPLEGTSLGPALAGGEGPDEVIGEYCAEGTVTPVMMIRRGKFKFVTAEGDPEQLYDLGGDRGERTNLAEDVGHNEATAAFRADARSRWDLMQITEQILESQRRRRFVAGVQSRQGVAWDYQPIQDASNAYIRNTLSLYEIEGRARFPRIR